MAWVQDDGGSPTPTTAWGADASPDRWWDPVETRCVVPPPLGVEVQRVGLQARLDVASRHPLTLVTAGPGWGKTTAVADWVRRRQARREGEVVWVTLTPADDSAGAFWDAVLGALTGARARPDGPPRPVVGATGEMSDEVRRRLFGWLAALSRPVVLVLDDFQVVGSADVLAALGDLAEHATALRLVLLTRSDPVLPLHRLRVAGRLAEVTAADLAFDAPAVATLARLAESLRLEPDQVATILARTEGWPAGVRLATMYLARQPADPQLRGFTGTDRSVAEFLVAEVLALQDAPTRQFLLRTSVAERLSGSLADALVPGGDGLARLEELERANHFVTHVDPQRTTFRYHPLLRDLLAHQFSRDDPQGFRVAHGAAARWLLGTGEPVSALEHAVRSQDWSLVAEAFFDASPWLLSPRRESVAALLREIPFESLPASAALELCAAGREFAGGHLEAVAGHAAAARGLVDAGERLPPLGMAVMGLLAGAAARATGDVPVIIDSSTIALRHLATAAPGTATDQLLSIGVNQRAVGLMLSGDLRAAAEALDGLLGKEPSESVALTLVAARAYQAWCDVLEGRLREGEVRAREVIRDASLQGWTSLMQLRPAYVSLATVLLLRGEGTAASTVVNEGYAADVGGVELWPSVALRLTHASVALERHHPMAAAAALRTALAAAAGVPFPPALADTLLRTRTDVALRTGRHLGDDAPGRLDPPARSATWWSSRGRCLLASGEHERAAAAAGRVPRDPDFAGLVDLLAAVEAWVVLALVAEHRRRPLEAARCMRRAADIARAERVVKPFLDAPHREAATILRRSLEEGLTRGDDFVEEILTALAGTDPNPHLVEPQPLVEPLSERELAVLAELPTMKTNSEIAAEFFVSSNTVKTQLQALYRKLAVSSRREAVRRGRELGLIP